MECILSTQHEKWSPAEKLENKKILFKSIQFSYHWVENCSIQFPEGKLCTKANDNVKLNLIVST